MTAPNRARRWVAVILTIYSGIVVFVGVVPRPIDRGVTPWIRGQLAYLHGHGLRDWIAYDFVEHAAHVALFVPFGILAVVAVGRRLAWLAVLAGIAVSVLVEVGPSYLGAGSPPVMVELLLNVVGVVLGAVIGWAVLAGTADALESRRVGRAPTRPPKAQGARSAPRRSLRGSRRRRATRT